MIGKLSGIIDSLALDHALIDVQGVGYVVFCAPSTLRAFTVGEAASVYTDMIVREDLLQLYGFLSIADRDWHRLLMSVQGVGAKAALAIVGALGVDGVERAIALEDAVSIRKAPGVGPKLASRIVRELAGKVPEGVISAVAPLKTVASDDALSALIGLGYQPIEARRALAAQDTTLETSARIKAALKLLAQEA